MITAENKAKADVQAKIIEDAKAKDELLARYQVAMPGVNVQTDSVPSGSTVQTDNKGTGKRYEDAMQDFFNQEYALRN